jgi:hypothetical protein
MDIIQVLKDSICTSVNMNFFKNEKIASYNTYFVVNIKE